MQQVPYRIRTNISLQHVTYSGTGDLAPGIRAFLLLYTVDIHCVPIDIQTIFIRH
jgi:hypothetical protein